MSKWEIVSKAISLVIVLFYSGFAFWGDGLEGLSSCVLLLIPLSLIWFPDAWGNYTGGLGRSNNNAVTPPFLVSIAGWFFLVVLPVLIEILQGWE